MKVNLQAVEKFAREVQADGELARKTKTVSGEGNFRAGEPHFTATLEFPAGKALLESDQLPLLGGAGSAPDPILYCLYGTAACFAGTVMLLLAQRNIALESLRVTAQNRLNLHKPLGLGEAPIVEGVWISVDYMGGADEAAMAAVVAEAVETCPAAWCLTHPIPLTTVVNKAVA